jgi:tetratricopeptide (TPR) repeat protein
VAFVFNSQRNNLISRWLLLKNKKMNFLKKLFGTDKDDTSKNDTSKTEEKEKERNKSENFIQVKSKSFFAGIDKEFIDLLFFSEKTERDEFIQMLSNLLDKLQINEKTDRPEVSEKLTNHLIQNELSIPFLIYLFKYDNRIITVRMPEGRIIKEDNGTKDYVGIEKLKHYHTALNVATYNIQRKIEANFGNIEFEENLINKALTQENMDYARIDALFLLGHFFCITGDLEKMNSYNNIIENDQYELSPNTVADFIRLIGEDYYSLGDLKKTHHYFSYGLNLNPKLGVKKILLKIESALSK